MKRHGLAGVLAGAGCLALALQAVAEECDAYCWLVRANEASLVMLHDTGLLSADEATTLATTLREVANAEAQPGARRSGNYLYLEQAMSREIGTLASKIHLGRSRQDLHGTVRRLRLRDASLAAYAAQLAAREALLAKSAEYATVVIPAYTHGVQAQPTSFGHYALAFAAALERDAVRFRAAYANLNRSPLGAAALGTSHFPIDRPALAALLGFSSPVENSYDANLVSSVDSKLELASALRISAIPVGQLMQNLHTQYHVPRPWMLLDDGQVSGSTIMPQKRNPRPLDRLRLRASQVVGLAQQADLNAHNTNTGMHDYRALETTDTLLASAESMYRQYANVIGGLRVDAVRAREELDRDYASMTEIADVLQREAGVNFRDGHHYASTLTRVGRTAGAGPMQLDDATLLATWRAEFGSELPVPVQTLRAAMDPVAMVSGRRGLGGPQPGEVQRMLVRAQQQLAEDEAWLQQRYAAITAANTQRSERFGALLK